MWPSSSVDSCLEPVDAPAPRPARVPAAGRRPGARRRAGARGRYPGHRSLCRPMARDRAPAGLVPEAMRRRDHRQLRAAPRRPDQRHQCLPHRRRRARGCRRRGAPGTRPPRPTAGALRAGLAELGTAGLGRLLGAGAGPGLPVGPGRRTRPQVPMDSLARAGNGARAVRTAQGNGRIHGLRPRPAAPDGTAAGIARQVNRGASRAPDVDDPAPRTPGRHLHALPSAAGRHRRSKQPYAVVCLSQRTPSRGLAPMLHRFRIALIACFGTGGQPAATDRARRWQLDRGPAPAELQLDADDLR
ncbi:hypothetical protein G6F68_010807 [Rhizopus microsporus]|nr:hypothetical protein G6F68_010807 [Rhizopus microsporus]